MPSKDKTTNGTLRTIVTLLVICGAVATSTIFILTRTNAAQNCADTNKVRIEQVEEKLDDKFTGVEEDLKAIDFRQRKIDVRQERMETKVDHIKEAIDKMAGGK